MPGSWHYHPARPVQRVCLLAGEAKARPAQCQAKSPPCDQEHSLPQRGGPGGAQVGGRLACLSPRR